MSHIFFIAGLHFGQKKIIEYEKDYRPFETIEQHDNELVKRWNEKVKKRFRLGFRRFLFWQRFIAHCRAIKRNQKFGDGKP